MTITNNYMINTSIAGCFLTAAGVWTDASSRSNKTAIKPVNMKRIPELIRSLPLREYKRIDPSDGGFTRYGVIAEEAPDYLADANHQGIAASYMAGFGLAGVKYLLEKIDQLEKQVAKLQPRNN